MSNGITVQCEVDGLDCPHCGQQVRTFALRQNLTEYSSFDDVEREDKTCPHCRKEFTVSVQLDVRYTGGRQYTQQQLFKCQ